MFEQPRQLLEHIFFEPATSLEQDVVWKHAKTIFYPFIIKVFSLFDLDPFITNDVLCQLSYPGIKLLLSEQPRQLPRHKTSFV
jgi:hypothetical protein